MSTPAAGLDATLYRPVRARMVLAAWALALGALGLFALQLPLTGRFFALVIGWSLIASGTLHWLSHHGDRALFFPARFALFSFELVVAAWLAHYIGASSWLGTLFLLFPAIEWNLLYPGLWGTTGSVLAVVASGALIAGEALEFVPPGALFPAIDPAYRDPPYALGALLVSAAVIMGLSTVVGRYAEAGRRQRRALVATQAELMGSAKLATLGSLVAGVAHEINTPLGALHSNHDTIRRALARLQAILADEVVDEDELEGVRRIVRAIDGVTSTNDMAVERMVRIVDSLRTFGRVDRSERDHADLHEGIDSTLAILGHELQDRVTVVKEYGDLPSVECYPDQIHQVFMNLIVNGAQAIQGRGTLTIRTRRAGQRVEIDIEDTGVGIPRNQLARIFDPGFTTKGKRMGMGMGLLIASRIVDRHGGRIDVASQPGEGSRFTVRLPVRMPVEADGDRGPDVREPAPDSVGEPA